MSDTPSQTKADIEKLYALLKADKRADTYVIPQRVAEIIVKHNQAIVQAAEVRAKISECQQLAKEIFSDVEIETYTDCLELLYERIAELTKQAEVSL